MHDVGFHDNDLCMGGDLTPVSFEDCPDNKDLDNFTINLGKIQANFEKLNSGLNGALILEWSRSRKMKDGERLPFPIFHFIIVVQVPISYGAVQCCVPGPWWQELFGRLLWTQVEPVPLAAFGVIPAPVRVKLIWVVPDNMVLFGPWFTPEPEPAAPLVERPVASTPG
jgi:hypothetical protein